MKKIIEINEGDGKYQLEDILWEWLKEKDYISNTDFPMIVKDIQIIIEIIEK